MEPERKRFVEQLDNLEAVERDLTPDMMREVAAKSADFRAIFNLGGGEKTKELLTHTIELMAMRDPDHFDNIYTTMRRVVEGKEKETQMLGELKDVAEAYKIPQQKFQEIVREKNSVRREQMFEAALRQAEEDQYGAYSFWKFFSKTGYTGKAAWLREREKSIQKTIAGMDVGDMANVAEARRKEVDKLLASIEKAKKDAGGALAAAFEENSDLNVALGRFLGGEKLEEEEATAFTEVRDNIPTKDQVHEKWKKFRDGKKDWSIANPTRQEQYRDEFMETEMKKPMREKTKSFKGFWSALLRGDSFWDEMKAGYNLT